MKMHFVLLILLLTATRSFGADHKPLAVIQVEKALSVEIVLDTLIEDSWNSITFDEIQDSTRIIAYLELLLVEYSKYPTGYLNKVNVEKIVICDNLRFAGQKRAAIPDPYKTTLYLEIDPSYTETYLIHVMHHELHHCTEYFLYTDMYYKWKQWCELNPKSFNYGEGGATAYQEDNQFIDYYSMIHPIEGFLNLYSTTGQEEDRCEIVAVIMTDSERTILLDYCANDQRLKRKTNVILSELSKVMNTQNTFWDTEVKVHL